MNINVIAAGLARKSGVRVILDPAPAAEVPSELLAHVDIITPNQSEARAITGIEVEGLDGAGKAIKIFQDKGVVTPIIKMGVYGVCWLENGKIEHQPAFKVKAIDTVAAGDAFNGGLASALDDGKSLADAIVFAQATAAICVTRKGAQQAMGKRNEIEALITKH
jgi:ribokinase